MERGTCDVLQVGQHQSLKGFYDYRREGHRPVVINPVIEGSLGTGITVDCLKQQGTSHSSRDLSKISVKTGGS